MPADIVIVPPGEGRVVPRRFGEQTIVKVAKGERTVHMHCARTRCPWFDAVPMHIHHTAEEAFYVLDGVITFIGAFGPTDAPPGSFVLIPRGTPHSIANRTSRSVSWLTLISPAWVSDWIEEEAADPGRQDEIYEKYGLEIVGPPPS